MIGGGERLAGRLSYPAMEKVTGIGGLFFRARDPKALAKWYETHLGISSDFAAPWVQEAGTTIFVPFKQDTRKFPADKTAMWNFRVKDLEKLVKQLRDAGIAVEVNPDYSFGRFAQLFDPENNAIELWQPNDD
jgi:predicted enzyme related to lactoylglutathione lyase